MESSYLKSNVKTIQFIDFLGNSLIAGAIFAFICYLMHYKPIAFIHFVSEDGWSEYATFVLYFFSSMLLLRTLIKDQTFRKPGFFALALILLLIAMEEISWGQRLFNFAIPDFFRTHNNQGELTLHNFVRAGRYYPYIGNILILGTFVLPILTMLFKRIRNLCERCGIPIISYPNWPFFIVPIFILEYYHYFPLKLCRMQEMAELTIAISISVVVKDLVLKPDQKKYCSNSILSTIKMIAIVVICTALLVIISRDESRLTSYLNKFAKEVYPEHGMYRQSGIVFDYIDCNPQFQERGFRYPHGLVLLKLGRKEEAKKTLNKALEEMEVPLLEKPNDPEWYRDKGKILHVLGRNDEAKMFYHKALELDRKRLMEGDCDKMEARYRWSLGKTLFAMGQREAADEQLQFAAQLAKRKQLWNAILQWIEKERRKARKMLPSEIKRIDVPPANVMRAEHTE